MAFQVVILAGGVGNRMYPLTDDIPKPMLPICNRPMLAYQLDLLERAGVESVLMVTIKSSEDAIRRYLAESYGGSVKVDLEVLKEQAGTASALRAVKDKIKTDFFVISSDMVTTTELHRLADVHRTQNAACTALLRKKPPKDLKMKKKKNADETVNYIGLSNLECVGTHGDERRLVYLASSADLEEEMVLDKNMLYRNNNVSISNDYIDAHLYIFAPWVVEVLEAKPNFESIRGELVPYLVSNQFVCEQSSLPNDLPAASMESSQSLAEKLNAASVDSQDRVRCIAYIQPQEDVFARANTVSLFMEVNRMVLNSSDPMTPWARAQLRLRRQSHDAPPTIGTKSQIGSDCLTGDGLRVGDRTSIKKSIIGPHCTIGSHVKISNCIIMDHVTVEDGVVLSNCILCNSSFVKEKSSLTDCQVGVSYTVAAGTSERSAALCLARD